MISFPGMKGRRDAYRLALLVTAGAVVASVALALAALHIMVPATMLPIVPHATAITAIAAAAISVIVAGPASLMLCLQILRANQLGEQIRRAALTDPLTGLPNRAALLDRLKEATDACQRAGQAGALLYIDLDHFKMINDQHGHAGGDAALRHAARIMREIIEPGMVLGRFGGEEFVAFAHNSGRAAATAMAMILALRSTSVQHHGTDICVTASIGIAVMGDAATPEALLANADRALYLAKSAGRDRVVHHEDIRDLEASLRRAGSARQHQDLAAAA
jgi:diguanylate cyclase (GGDEF)-like protein